MRLALALACLAGLAAAEDGNRIRLGDDSVVLFGNEGNVKLVERGRLPLEIVFHDPLGKVVGWSRPDRTGGGISYYTADGRLSSTLRPNYSTGYDVFDSEGGYRGMVVAGAAGGYDVNPSGQILPEGHVLVGMYWTDQLGIGGSARY